MCLKLKAVHKFTESEKKSINIIYICDYRVGVDITVINACILKVKSNTQ